MSGPGGSLPSRVIRRAIFTALGLGTAAPFGAFNRFHVEGRELLAELPPRNVLFVANHLTYFFDVIALHHALASGRAAPLNGLRSPAQLGFVAARETMSRGVLPRLFALGGAVLVRRTWKRGDDLVQRPPDPDDLRRIGAALRDGWLISFPQGTTRRDAPIRKSTSLLIREHQPVVVPTQLEGFERAFSRTGVGMRAVGVDLRVRFSEPLRFSGRESPSEIGAALADALRLDVEVMG